MNNWLGLIICFTYIFAMIGGRRGAAALAWLLQRLHAQSHPHWRGHDELGAALFVRHSLVFCGGLRRLHGDQPAGLALRLFCSAMASSDRSNLGTVYFPLAAAIVALVFWEQPPLMVAALMPLTWGDGMAPVVGKAYGRRLYMVHTSTRSVEGSMGFFAGCLIFTWLALWVVGGTPDISPNAALIPALIITISTTLVEAVSIWGLDNLTITAVASSSYNSGRSKCSNWVIE
jgi:dolichol kinase